MKIVYSQNPFATTVELTSEERSVLEEKFSQESSPGTPRWMISGALNGSHDGECVGRTDTCMKCRAESLLGINTLEGLKHIDLIGQTYAKIWERKQQYDIDFVGVVDFDEVRYELLRGPSGEDVKSKADFEEASASLENFLKTHFRKVVTLPKGFSPNVDTLQGLADLLQEFDSNPEYTSQFEDTRFSEDGELYECSFTDEALHPIIQLIITAANGLLITKGGHADFSAIRHLRNLGWRVIKGESDSFGWLTGVIVTEKADIVYG